MCRVSDKIKLCTCSTDIEKLKDYWVFHRYDKGKNNMVIGEPMLPHYIDPADETFNWALLLRLLNEGDIFDIELHPKAGDRLELAFKYGEDSFPRDSRLHYGFCFSKGKWVKDEFDGLEWMWHHNEERYGKIMEKKERKEGFMRE
jgi:hypothetical protein